MKTSSSAAGVQLGFTLIELLVVMAIISTLMGLSATAYASVMRSARRTDAKAMLVGLTQALSRYDLEYGRLPPGSGADDEAQTLDAGCALLPVLLGEDAMANPRGIGFLDQRGLTSAEGGWALLDPWGTPIQVWLDGNADGWLEEPGSAEGSRLPTKALAASAGPDRRWDSIDDVRSWR